MARCSALSPDGIPLETSQRSSVNGRAGVRCANRLRSVLPGGFLRSRSATRNRPSRLKAGPVSAGISGNPSGRAGMQLLRSLLRLASLAPHSHPLPDPPPGAARAPLSPQPPCLDPARPLLGGLWVAILAQLQSGRDQPALPAPWETFSQNPHSLFIIFLSPKTISHLNRNFKIVLFK